MLVPPRFEDIAFEHGDFSRIDIDRAWFQALVADGAVIGDILEPLKQLELGRSLTLGYVKQRLDQRTDSQILVSRVVEHPPCRIKNTAVGLAFPAADTEIHMFRQLLDLGPFENMGFEFEQVERGREDMIENLEIIQFARIHDPFGVDRFSILRKLPDTLFLHILELGQADAVLSRHDTPEFDNLFHHLIDNMVRPAKHRLVVREHRNIDMDIAVSGMHVRCDDNTPVAYIFKRLVKGRDNTGIAVKQLVEAASELLHTGMRAERLFIGLAQFFPCCRTQIVCRSDLCGKLLSLVFDHNLMKRSGNPVDERKLRIPLFLDIEVIDKAGEFSQCVERNNDILVQLERVCSPGNGTELFPVGPVQFGLLGIAGNEKQGVGMAFQQFFNLFHAILHRFRIMTGNIDQQNGFRHTCPGRLDLVFNRLDVLVVEMLEGKQRLAVVLGKRENTRQFDDDLAGFVHVRPEKLEAEGRRFLVLRVEHKHRRGDHTVRPLFLQTRHAAERLVGYIFPETLFADVGSFQLNFPDGFTVIADDLIGNGVVRHDLAKPVIGSADPPVLS